MEWTVEQQEAIDVREKNILVSAAAGSGKTAVLVERIKGLIINDEIPIDRMLIVTFSNAAASEMREKIIEAISKELDKIADSGPTSSKLVFLRNQLNLINKANISTFHAFAMEVIKRYFYLINIEPNFKICDEAQKTILQADSMEQLFGNMFESCSQDFFDFLTTYAHTKNDNAVKEMIFEVHNFIQSIPDSYDWLRRSVDELAFTRDEFEHSMAFLEMLEEIRRGFDQVANYFSKVSELLENQGISSLIKKCKLETDNLNTLKNEFETLPYNEFVVKINAFKFQTFTASKVEKESYEEIKEAVASLRDQGKQMFKKIVSQYLARPLDSYVEDINKTHKDAVYLCFLVKEFDSIYKEKKQSKGLIDFNDLEHYALAVLGREEVAGEYRDKFEYIFVDEYQDNNVVQEAMIDKIKRENNLFMVGDVKQSIYKFRLAEPELFIKKYEAYKENKSKTDIKIDLNKNFRSKANIIAAVNDIFKQIMNKRVSGLEYDAAAALKEGNPYVGELNYPVELQLVDDIQLDDTFIDDEIKEMKKAEMEAYAAAQIIKDSRGLLIYDRKREVDRPITNKDIVILLRGARGYADIYYEALMREGIVSFVDTGDGYFDTLEIEVFLNLIRIIDNRKQDIPLLSILRSPIFGFNIEELILVRIHNKEIAYYKALAGYALEGEADSLREKCRTTLSRLSQWKKEAPVMPLEEFLWMLIRETGYYEYIGGIPGGSQRQANLRALVDKAVQFQSSQMKGLFGFINYIEAIKKRKVPMGQVKLLGENDDVIRIMTIHKSKGLEFPMVLVGGLGKRFNQDSGTPQLSLHKDIGIALRYIDEDNACYKKTLIQTVIEQKKKREGLAEELRILYVAFTRAMDKLILLGTLRDIEAALEAYEIKGSDLTGAKSYLDFLIPSIGNSKIVCKRSNRNDIYLRKDEDEKQKNVIRRIIDGETAPKQEKDEFLAEIDRRLNYEYGYKAALQLKSKFTVSELNRFDEEHVNGRKMASALLSPKFLRQSNRLTGAEKGTVLHKVLEQLDFSKFATICSEGGSFEAKLEFIKALVNGLIEKEILTTTEAEAISYQKLIGFFDSDIGKRACNARKLDKEVSFNIMKEWQEEKIIIQGTIDCYFEEDGKYILLDYKSNFISDSKEGEEVSELVRRYTSQLTLYKEALEVIREVEVGEVYLYLFSIDREVRVY